MKAIALKEHGNLDNVALVDVPEPAIGPKDVLLEVKAAALNRLDLWVVEGWRGLDLSFPHIMGCDAAGIIRAVGDEVEGFSVGDHVAINPTLSCGKCRFCISGRDHMCDRFAIFGEHVPGFYARYQAVPDRNLVSMPDSAAFELAAAASLVYVTAWHSLIQVGNFQAGEHILILGAGGGVNTAYIDIARYAGAGKIYVVGSSDEKLSLARQLGADETINRHEEDWGRAVHRLSGREGVDVVIDNVGAATFMTSLRCLRKGGRLLTVGNSSGPKFEFDNRYLFARHLTLIGTSMGPRHEYRKVMELVFSGRLKPTIDTVFAFEDGLEALRRLESGDVAGKLVLKL